MKLHYPNNIVDISIMRNGVDKTKFLFKPGLKEEKTEMYDFYGKQGGRGELCALHQTV